VVTIYDMANMALQVHVRKVKLLKAPKFDLGALLGLHGESNADDSGQKVRFLFNPLTRTSTNNTQVEREFKETVLENV
jgi:small subunit ribosomal protein S3Ae